MTGVAIDALRAGGGCIRVPGFVRLTGDQAPDSGFHQKHSWNDERGNRENGEEGSHGRPPRDRPKPRPQPAAAEIGVATSQVVAPARTASCIARMQTSPASTTLSAAARARGPASPTSLDTERQDQGKHGRERQRQKENFTSAGAVSHEELRVGA